MQDIAYYVYRMFSITLHLIKKIILKLQYNLETKCLTKKYTIKNIGKIPYLSLTYPVRISQLGDSKTNKTVSTERITECF